MSGLQHFLTTFFVTGPAELASDGMILLTCVAIVWALTHFKLWGYLWREWLTTVDHKRIGIMYMIAALAMMFRGGVDALMMRAQLAVPNAHVLSVEHYDQVFTTHGTIMILFMAMPLIFAMFNIAVPLLIGARDVAFPYLNAVSFWLFLFGAMLFNISFVIGGSPDGGWMSYPPLTEGLFSPGPGENYYLLALQISSIGSIATAVNFITTIFKMRAPGMTLMRMPMFVWSVLVCAGLILWSFPPLSVALAQLMIDRLFGAHFFTMSGGGMPMMYANLFWLWGHPEVYIVVLPSFGIYSEVVSTFSGKKLFGYPAMVGSLIAISILSYFVWAHHFFVMGAGPAVNSFFGLASMLIAIPTGVKIFNWLFTMYRGRVRMTTAMLWSLAFIPCFTIGGATGVMLAAIPADYQYHNSYFLVAHFHNVLIGGVVFGLISGIYYWWPKMFGFILNEMWGKIAFWFFQIGFYVTFVPQYILGYMGMTRRMYTYPSGLGWNSLNFVSTVGSFIMGLGFLFMVIGIVYSIKYGERDLTGDPWNGRTLEWSIPSPAPHYNFARIPVVTDRDAWWEMKNNRAPKPTGELQPIHMPKSSGRPFILSFFFFIAGFGFVFEWYVPAVAGLIGVLVCMWLRSFEYDDSYFVSVEEISRHEAAFGRS